jgi:hypothetical protein
MPITALPFALLQSSYTFFVALHVYFKILLPCSSSGSGFIQESTFFLSKDCADHHLLLEFCKWNEASPTPVHVYKVDEKRSKRSISFFMGRSMQPMM